MEQQHTTHFIIRVRVRDKATGLCTRKECTGCGEMVLKGRRVLYGLEKAGGSGVRERAAVRVSGRVHVSQENVQFPSKSCLTRVKKKLVTYLKLSLCRSALTGEGGLTFRKKEQVLRSASHPGRTQLGSTTDGCCHRGPANLLVRGEGKGVSSPCDHFALVRLRVIFTKAQSAFWRALLFVCSE